MSLLISTFVFAFTALSKYVRVVARERAIYFLLDWLQKTRLIHTLDLFPFLCPCPKGNDSLRSLLNMRYHCFTLVPSKLRKLLLLKKLVFRVGNMVLICPYLIPIQFPHSPFSLSTVYTYVGTTAHF